MKGQEKIKIVGGIFALFLTFSIVFYYISNSGCGGGGGGFTTTPTTSVSEQQTILSFTGYVYNSLGSGVENANVFLIPNTSIDTTTIIQSALIYKKGTLMLSGTARASAGAGVVSEAEAYDEPIEDLIIGKTDAELNARGIFRSTTDSFGKFLFTLTAKTTDKFYLCATPPTGNTELLPGGDKCKRALSVAELMAGVNINLSSSPPANATFVGSSTCLTCHPTYESEKYTAHRLGISVPGQDGPLQDKSKYPKFNNGLTKFKSGTTYTAGTVLCYCDYDGTRGFDKFEVYEVTSAAKCTTGDKPANCATPTLIVYLWKDSNDNKYKITMENYLEPVNEPDPANPRKTYEVALTYGGAVYKQRYLLKIPNRDGLYPFLQYQIEGDDTIYDRTSKVWRDYKMDTFWDNTNRKLKEPDKTKTFEGECAACHFTGYTLNTAGKTLSGEYLADAVDDVNGEYDIDGDGKKDEINIGCEVCHGPGSAHATLGQRRYIVGLSKITPERQNQVCNQCHDRPQGNGTVKNEQPLNSSNKMMIAGTKRSEFLANYTSTPSAKGSDLWSGADGVHSKSHHQQGTDFLKSKHYRNDSELVTCSDCHDPHNNPNRHQTRYSPDDPNSPLCQRCHTIDVSTHMLAKASMPLSAPVACVKCHMPKTAKSGAAKKATLLGTPTGQTTDEDIVYLENDISSHTFIVPSRFNIAKIGLKPGQAMPIPYTNSCGSCHNTAQLKTMNPLDSSTCGGCHATEYNQWTKSGHSNKALAEAEAGAGGGFCARCHTAQQFIKSYIAGDSDATVVASEAQPQTCAVCHYPHYSADATPHQLRVYGKVTFPTGETVDAGPARACIMCHNQRATDNPSSKAVPAWSSGTCRLSSTPHVGNQADTFLGVGAVSDFTTGAVDQTTIQDSYHATDNFKLPGQTKSEMCITCHMYKEEGLTATDESHNFEPKIEACKQCHGNESTWSQWGGAPTPAFNRPAPKDYDGDGTVEGIQDEYRGLLARVLAALIRKKDNTGYDLSNVPPEMQTLITTYGSGIKDANNQEVAGFGFTYQGGYPYWNFNTTQTNCKIIPDGGSIHPDSAKAAWNFVLFEHAEKGGVIHNAAYAITILRATWRALGRALLNNTNWNPPGNDY